MDDQFITPEQYSYYQSIGYLYTGYVTGIGYAYKAYNGIPAGWRYSHSAISNNVLMAMQLLDATPDAKLRSLHITPKDILEKIYAENANGTCTVHLGQNQYISVPKNNNRIDVKINDTPAGLTLEIAVYNTLTLESKQTKLMLRDFPVLFGENRVAVMNSTKDIYRQEGNNPIEYIGLANDIALATAMGYNALDKGLKRKYAYQLSKYINVKPGNIYQSAKSFGKSSAKVLGKTANIIAIGSIAYDFGTGNANTATLVDAGLLIGGTAAIFFIGSVAVPFVLGVGIVYGVSCLFGLDDYINEKYDYSGSINFINNRE